jgi:hypothetical protein
MLLDKPHCPFKWDIFQLGKMFLSHFHASYLFLSPVVPTVDTVNHCCEGPEATLKSIHEYHDGFTRAQLMGLVPEPIIDTVPLEVRFRKMREANARKAAREKKHMDVELVQTSTASS